MCCVHIFISVKQYRQLRPLCHPCFPMAPLRDCCHSISTGPTSVFFRNPAEIIILQIILHSWFIMTVGAFVEIFYSGCKWFITKNNCIPLVCCKTINQTTCWWNYLSPNLNTFCSTRTESILFVTCNKAAFLSTHVGRRVKNRKKNI